MQEIVVFLPFLLLPYYENHLKTVFRFKELFRVLLMFVVLIDYIDYMQTCKG